MRRVTSVGAAIFCALFCLTLTPRSVGAAPPAKIYAIVTVQLLPGKYDTFLKFMDAEEVDLGSADGVKLVDSYTIQIGDAGEIVDIWEARDYNALNKVFFENPEGLTAKLGTMFASFQIKTAIKNPLKYRK